MRRLVAATFFVLLVACGEQHSRELDLPSQPDRRVQQVMLQGDSKVTSVGQTNTLLGTTKMVALKPPKMVSVGQEIDGIGIGVIVCSYHVHDQSYGNERYMWRGRWSCLAGRNEKEVLNAVTDDGVKAFPYIHIVPVSLDTN